MKKLRFTITIIFSLFVISCENTDVVDIDVGYKEYIVVRSELKADSVFSGVTFTRTLPINTVYDIKKAELKDVFAYLLVDGLQIVTLSYSADGIYKPLFPFSIQAGSYYELFAKANGKQIYAQTTVPENPRINRAAFYVDKYVDVFISSRPNECYGSVYYIAPTSTGYAARSTDFFAITESPNSDLNSLVASRTQDIPEQFQTSVFRNLTYVRVFAFDRPYSDYFKTRGNNQPITNSFIQGGDPIAWNVEGEGVIGLFIGENISSLVKVSQ